MTDLQIAMLISQTDEAQTVGHHRRQVVVVPWEIVLVQLERLKNKKYRRPWLAQKLLVSSDTCLTTKGRLFWNSIFTTWQKWRWYRHVEHKNRDARYHSLPSSDFERQTSDLMLVKMFLFAIQCALRRWNRRYVLQKFVNVWTYLKRHESDSGSSTPGNIKKQRAAYQINSHIKSCNPDKLSSEQ